MILSDRELRAALNRGALRITPDPPAEAWSSTALDLRLATELGMAACRIASGRCCVLSSPIRLKVCNGKIRTSGIVIQLIESKMSGISSSGR